MRLKFGNWKLSEAGRSGLDVGHLLWFNETNEAMPELESLINSVFQMYLSTSAPFEINLPGDLLEAIRKCFGPNERLLGNHRGDIPRLLCKAQDAIYDLMHKDSYVQIVRVVVLYLPSSALLFASYERFKYSQCHGHIPDLLI